MNKLFRELFLHISFSFLLPISFILFHLYDNWTMNPLRENEFFYLCRVVVFCFYLCLFLLLLLFSSNCRIVKRKIRDCGEKNAEGNKTLHTHPHRHSTVCKVLFPPLSANIQPTSTACLFFSCSAVKLIGEKRMLLKHTNEKYQK